MTSGKLTRAKGATQYDIVGMGDEDFERMNGRLIVLEFPEAYKPSNSSDGGADMVLPKDGGGYERCWQSKHYPGSIHWDKCLKSLGDAREHWQPEHYTFCFPRELTVGEQKTFDRHFRGPTSDIRVDHWNGEALQTRLNGSDAGQRVARTFFDDVELDRENTYRAIEAAGRLDSVQEAASRLSNLGAFLASKDAFFSYPASTHEANGPAPAVTRGAVMSFAESDGVITSRVDIVPRDAEAMERYGPQFVVSATEGPEGERALQQLQRALQEGDSVEIGTGLAVTFTQMPPAFSNIVGQPINGSVTLGPSERPRRVAPPWHARLRSITDVGSASLDVLILQAETVPDGWDDQFVASYGGLTVNLRFRQRDTGGQLEWNFRYSRDHSPVRQQLAALEFFRTLCGTGEFVVSDRGTTARPDLRMPTRADEFPPDSRVLLAFLHDVRTIEQWADVEYVLPETVSGRDAHAVATVARIVLDGGWTQNWKQVQMTLSEPGLIPLRSGRLLRIEHQAQVRLLGRVVDLGYRRFDIAEYKLTSVEPAPDRPGEFKVSIEPVDPDDAAIFEHLTKTRGSQRRPPPPPPRKLRGAGKRRRSKRR